MSTKQSAAQFHVRSTLLAAFAAFAVACDDGAGPDAVVHVIEVAPHTQVVAVGDTIELTARPKAPDGTVRTDVAVTWNSRHAELAAVLDTGRTVRVAALRAGLAEISASTHGKTGIAIIEVRNAVPVLAAVTPASVTAGGPDITIRVNGSGFVPGAEVLWNGAPRPTLHSSATELRAVLSAADIAAAGAGEIRVSNPLPGGGASGPIALPIMLAAVAVVDMQPGALQLVAGDSAAILARARDMYGRELGRTAVWSSSNTQVAVVTQSGVVRALTAGTAFITATVDGVVGSTSVTVSGGAVLRPVVTAVTPDSVDSTPDGFYVTVRGQHFVESSMAMLNGSTQPTDFISPTELRMYLWPGMLANPGTPQVRVTTPAAGVSDAVSLRVVPGVWTIWIDAAEAQLWPGQETQLTATAYDGQNRVVDRPATWSSAQPGVATIDGSGRVTAVGPGTTTIRVQIGGRSAHGTMRVLEPLAFDLLYEGTHGGLTELWLLTPGPDAAPRRVLPAGTYGADPAASPDGSKIAYVGLSSAGHRSIFVVDRNGANHRQLTFTSAADDQPAWSPDGTKIAFRRRGELADVYVMNADGSGQVNVTRNGERASVPLAAERPAWTPGGRLVFSFGYQNLNPLQYGLVSTLPDGSDWKQLTDGITFSDFEPDVSPDGRLIALRRRSAARGDQIDIIRDDGTALMWINTPGVGRTPAWSPDGQWLSYAVPLGVGTSAIHMTRPNVIDGVVLVPTGGSNPSWIRRAP
jgi:uncharacterized protein YjdB